MSVVLPFQLPDDAESPQERHARIDQAIAEHADEIYALFAEPSRNDCPFTESLGNMAQYCGVVRWDSGHAYAKRPCGVQVPNKILGLQRAGNESLEEYLEVHQNCPTPGVGRNFVHESVQDELRRYPEALNFSPDFRSYSEVELVLRPEQQMLHALRGTTLRNYTGKEEDEGKVWLTAVDNIFYDPAFSTVHVLGVITRNTPEVRQRELRPLRNAIEFFHYNWPVRVKGYLVLTDNLGVRGEPYELCPDAPKIHLKKHLNGVFS